MQNHSLRQEAFNRVVETQCNIRSMMSFFTSFIDRAPLEKREELEKKMLSQALRFKETASLQKSDVYGIVRQPFFEQPAASQWGQMVQPGSWGMPPQMGNYGMGSVSPGYPNFSCHGGNDHVGAMVESVLNFVQSLYNGVSYGYPTGNLSSIREMLLEYYESSDENAAAFDAFLSAETKIKRASFDSDDKGASLALGFCNVTHRLETGTFDLNELTELEKGIVLVFMAGYNGIATQYVSVGDIFATGRRLYLASKGEDIYQSRGGPTNFMPQYQFFYDDIEQPIPHSRYVAQTIGMRKALVSLIATLKLFELNLKEIVDELKTELTNPKNETEK